MTFELPPLPFEKDALQPHISAETLDFHYGKHHQAYVTNLNKLTEGTDLATKTLEELIKSQSGGVFNNAAQIWNHTFYWNSLSPNGGGSPTGPIEEAINTTFGSFDGFKAEFSKAAAGQFGSGWAWLVQDENGKVAITTTANADTPLQGSSKPLLTCDVWEHAYYIDYRNARPKYIESWWNLVNWDFANANLN